MLLVPSLLLLAPLQVAGVQLDRLPGARTQPDAFADCVTTPVVPGYVDALNLGLEASLFGCNASSPRPWSGRTSPDGQHIYVTLFGGVIGSSNCLVAKLDAQTNALVDSFQVGLGPEEIVFTTTAPGVMQYGFVTNSSGSSVSVFDATDTVVATIPISVQPGYPWGTAFPFGLAVTPDQSIVYVGTLDGSGNVYAIDVATLTLDPTETLSFGPDHGFGRLAVVGDTLVVPVTVSHPSFQGSTAEVAFVDLVNGGPPVERVLASSTTAFPNPVDVAVWCDRAYVSGFDMGPFVYELMPATGELLARIPSGTSNRLGKLQALGSDGHGLLVVCDFFTGEVAWIDATRRSLLGVLDTGTLPDFHAQLNDVVTGPGGTKLLVMGQGSSTVIVFERP